MSDSNQAVAEAMPARGGRPTKPTALPIPFIGASLLLLACYSLPLYKLVTLSFGDDLYSHVVLIPLVSLYLAWTRREELPVRSDRDRTSTIAFIAAGAIILAAYWLLQAGGAKLGGADALAFTISSLLLMFVGVCSWFLGRQTVRALAFPLGFLVFMVPFPGFVRDGLEAFLQYGSALTSYAMIKGVGTPIFREGLIYFHLPGITLEVAPQCSGIRSTLALFITSVVAGHFFLRTRWKRAVLTFAVIPLALLRNGLRIFTLAQLCVHISPEMINSFVHHHGGPIFFAISLIPFFILLRVFYKSDQRKAVANA